MNETKTLLKLIGRRTFALLLVVFMLVGYVPCNLLVLNAYAATNLSISVTNLSASYENDSENYGTAKWENSNGAITGTVTGRNANVSGCNAVSKGARESTLTFTSNSTYPATLSFSYTLTLNNGTVTVNGASKTSNGTFSKTLNQGGTVKIVIKSEAAASTTSISIKNLKLTVNPVAVTAATANSTMGTASVSPTSVTPQGSATFTASPKPGYKFVKWTNAAGDGVSASNPYTLTNITSATTLTANFEEIETTTVTFAPSVSVSGDRDGGSYTVSGSKISGTQTLAYNSENISNTDYVTSIVTLTAEPKTGYAFDGWFDASGGSLSTDLTWTPTLEQIKGKTIHAQFSSNAVSVLFGPTSSTFPNGYYTVTANGNTQTMRVDSAEYRLNGQRTDSVTVQAYPDADYEFLGWMNAALEPVHYQNPLTQPLAFFEQAGEIFPVFQYTKATVTFAETDKASYTATVGGANQTLGQVVAADPDAEVVLTLGTVDEDYTFNGWGDGKGNTLSTETTYTTTMRAVTGYKETPHSQSDAEVIERSQSNYTVSPDFTWKKTTLTLVPGANGTLQAGTSGSLATISAQTTVTELSSAQYTLKAIHTGAYVFVGWFDGNGRSINTNAEWTESFGTLAAYGTIMPKFQSAMVTMTVTASANGTTKLGDETVSGTKSYTLDSRLTYTLVAAADDGYMFSGWLDQDNNSLSTTSTWTTPPLDGKTVHASFVATGDIATWDVGGTTYNDLNAAIAAAQSNSITTVTLANDRKTLPAGTYTIPSGITVLIPKNSDYTLSTTQPKTVYKYSTPSIYRTLMMAPGAKITINSGGSLCVNATVASTDGGNNGSGSPSAAASQIIMQKGSQIEVNGTLYAWGFITAPGKNAASGSVTVNSSGRVYECIQIADQPGGTAATALEGHSSKTFFFNKYYIQNVEVPMTLYSGATETVFTDIYIQGERTTSATLIGKSSGLFQLSSGALTKTYHPETDRTQYDVSGNATIASISMSLYGISMDTADYILPINSNMDIHICSGKTTLKNETELHPSVTVTIDKGAELVIGSTLYLFDSSDWESTYYGPVQQSLQTVPYSPTKGSTKHTADKDATIDVNGLLTVSGKIYCTVSGADVTSSEKTGKVVLSTAPGSNNAQLVKATKTARSGFSGSVTATETITMYPLMLHNGVGDFTKTAGSTAGTVYYYCSTDNKWETAHDLTYHSNLKVDSTEPQSFTGTAASIKDIANVDSTWTNPGYTFTGWNTKSDGTGDAVEAGISYTFNSDAIPTDLYAQWEADTYTLTLNPMGGTVDPTTATITYDATYGEAFKTEGEETGELPIPVRNSQYATYTFMGWFTQSTGGTAVTSTDKVAVTENTTLYARWAVTYKVSFITGKGATEVPDQQVEYNGYVTMPDPAPTKPHYYLSGWYADESLETEFDFYTRVTDEVTIYAKWEPKSAPTAENVTVTLPANLVYTGTAKAVTAAAKSGLEGFGEISIKYYQNGQEVTAANVKNAGTYTYKVSVAEGDRYDSADNLVEGTFEITKAALTVTAKPKTITYGDAPANDGVTYSGFVNGETQSVLDGTLGYDYTYTCYGNVGTYKITPKGYTSNNYTITYAQGNLTVNKKTVGLTWGTSTWTYDKQSHVPAATATGLVNNDAITVAVTGAQTNAGSYTATASALTGDKAGNYALPSAKTQNFTINKKDVTITGLGASDKVYDGKTTVTVTGTAALSGVISGDTVTVKTGSAAFSDKNVGTGKTVTFSGYSIEGVSAGNYNLKAQPASVTANITAKSVTITGLGASDKTYDGTVAASVTGTAAISGLVSGDTVTVKAGTAAFADKNVGIDKTVSFTGYSLQGADAGNYTLTAQPASVTASINKATLTVTAKAKTITYGDAPTNDGVSYTGFVGGEDASALGGTLSYAYTYEKFGNVGSYKITPSGLTSDNYNITFVESALTVSPKELGLTWGIDNWTYDKQSHVPTVTATGMVNGDTIGVTVTGEQTDAGSYTATASALTGEKADNYKLPTANTHAFTIGQKEIGIVWSDVADFEYDGTEHVRTATASGVLTGDTCTVTVSGASKDVGTHTATATGVSNTNYKLPSSGLTAQFSIGASKLIITVTADQSKVYGAAEPALTYTVSGLHEGDSMTGALERVAGENVGTYAITQGTLYAGGNYTYEFHGADFTITPKAVTVKAEDKSMGYGEDEPALTAKVTGLAEGEAESLISYSLTRVTGSDVGTYTITPNGAASQGNYSVTFETGTFTITKAMTNTVMVSLDGWTYGDAANTPTASTTFGVPVITYSDAEDGIFGSIVPTTAGTWYVKAAVEGTTNYAAGEAVTSFTIAQKAVTITTGSDSKVYDGIALTNGTANIEGLVTGEGVTLTTTGTITNVGTAVNTYDITWDNAIADNYNVTENLGTLEVTRANITPLVTLEGWTYGEPANSPSVIGNSGNGTVTYTYSDAENGTFTSNAPTNAGTWYVKASVAATSNYNGGEAVAPFVIARKAITVTAQNASKIYGADDPTLTAVVDGLLGENAVSYAVTREEGENAGAYAITVSGETTQGNYTVSYIPAVFTINAKAVTVTADNAAKVYGTDDPALTAAVDGLLGEDTVSYAVTREEGENVGEYAITVSGETTQGNYSVSYVPGTLTISRATVTVTADAKSKIAGNADPAFTATVTGLKNGDTEGLIAYTLARATGETAGTYTITPTGEGIQGNYEVVYVPAYLTIEAAVASVTHGDAVTCYTSLADAIAAAQDGDTVTLVADDRVSLTTGGEIEINKSLTVTGAADAQGNPLYSVYGTSGQTGTNDIFITGSGTVTLENINFTGFGNEAATDIGHAPIYVSKSFTGTVNLTNLHLSDFNRGGMFLYGGNFHVADCYIDCANSRSGAFTKGIEIKGTASGTISDTLICNMERASTDYANAGIEIYGTGNVIVEGCTILSDDNGHASPKATYGIVVGTVGANVPGNAKLTVTDTMISATNGALSVDAANYKVELTGNSFDNYIAVWADGTTAVINSGDYAEDVYADAGKILIHGGEFTNFAPDTGTSGSIAIDGGIFDAEVPEEYCAEGYIPAVYDEESGLYTVEPGWYVTFEDEDGMKLSHTAYPLNTVAADIVLPADPVKAETEQYLYTFNGWMPEVADVIENATYTATYSAREKISYETFSVTIPEQTYNGQELTPAVTLMNGETALIEGTDYTVTLSEGRINAGEYEVTITGIGAYADTRTATFTILPVGTVTVTVTGHVGTAEYDGTAHTVNGYDVEFSSDLYTAEDFSFSGTASAAQTNVGTATMGLAAEQFANTNSNFSTVIFEVIDGYQIVTRKGVTVTAEDKTKVYGESDPALTATVTGLVVGESEDLIAYSVTREAGDAVGSYIITPAGDSEQGNYSVSYVPGTLTVTEAPMVDEVSAEGYTGTYDAAGHGINMPAFPGAVVTYSTDGTSYSETAPNFTDAGEYTVFYKVEKANFTTVTGSETVTISRKAATVKADAKNKAVGTEDPEFTATVTGLVEGEAESLIAYSISREVGETVGSYTITPAGEAEQGNYSVTYKTAKLTVGDVEYTAANGAVSYKIFGTTVITASGTYKLLQDVTVTGRLAPGILASDITLDLNRYTLTSTASDYGILLSRAGNTGGPKTFNLISSEVGGGFIATEANAAIQIQGNYNNVTVGENVTVEGCVALLKDNDTLTVDGVINGGSDFAIATNGSTTSNATITVNGTVTSNVTAIYLPGGADATINGSVTGRTGVEIRAGSLTVNNGAAITATSSFSAVANGSGTTVNGVAIAISQHNTNLPITVTVNGGTLEGEKAIYETDLQDETTEGLSLSVNDGTFVGTIESENLTGFVHDGEFSETVDPKYVEDGKLCTTTKKNGNGYYYIVNEVTVTFIVDGETVAAVVLPKGEAIPDNEKPAKPISETRLFAGWTNNDITYELTEAFEADITLTAAWTDAEAQIGTTPYATLADAVAAANTGDTVKLLKDAAADRVTVSRSLTLDLNGKTYIGRLTVDNGSVSVENGTINGRFDIYDRAAVTLAADTTVNGQAIVWGDGRYGEAGCKTPILNAFGVITNTGDAAISTNGTDRSGAVINIFDGAAITSTDEIGIYLPSGNLNISGGSITGTTAVYVKSGSVSITGGTLTGNGAANAYSFNGNGANATGDALVIESCDYPNGAPSVSVVGGTFISANGKAIAGYASEGSSAVTGFVEDGEFSTPLDVEIVKEGYQCTTTLRNDDGYYYIVAEVAVSFNANGGSAVETIKIPKGEAVPEPTTERIGYTFKAWQLGGENYDFSAAVNEDIELTATWTPIPYTITWLDDDGSVIDTTTVDYDDMPTHAAGQKADTADYHYDFTGWTPTVVPVTGDASYTATYSETERTYGDPVWTWEGTQSATAVFATNDAYTEFVLTEAAEITHETTTTETCEEDGIETYMATVTFRGKTYTNEKEEIRPAYGHDYVYTYVWSSDNGRVIARRVCQNDRSHTDFESVATTSEVTKQASCTEHGEITYTAAFTKEYFETQTKAVETPFEHNYGASEWVWLDDSTAYVEIKCCECGTTMDTVAATVSGPVRTEPTCEVDGSIVYTATAIYDGQTLTDTRSEAIPATGHSLTEHVAHAATCTADGNSAYWSCDACGKYFADAEGTAEVETDSWIITALGHSYTLGGWTWAEDHSTAIACFTCEVCGNSITVADNDIESVTVPATEQGPGSITYTASVVFDGNEYSDQRSVAVEFKKLDHPNFTIVGVIEEFCPEREQDIVTITDSAAGTFTVSYDKACVVAVKTIVDGEEVYTRLSATASDDADTYAFDLSELGYEFDSDIEIVVAVKGDVNGDGRINALDAGQVKAASISKLQLKALGILTGDVNGDGRINALDAGQVKAASISKLILRWDTISN